MDRSPFPSDDYAPDPAAPAPRRGRERRAPVTRTSTDVEPVRRTPVDDYEPFEEREVPFERDRTEQTVELREEELVPRREVRERGQVRVRTRVEHVPAELDVDSVREEVEVEHIPVGQVVTERRDPWQDGDALVVPVYEEQQVVVKRLVLREQIRVRRVRSTERQHFQDTLRREQLEVEDPNRTGMVHERYPEVDDDRDPRRDGDDDGDDPRYQRDVDADDRGGRQEGNFLEALARKVLQ